MTLGKPCVCKMLRNSKVSISKPNLASTHKRTRSAILAQSSYNIKINVQSEKEYSENTCTCQPCMVSLDDITSHHITYHGGSIVGTFEEGNTFILARHDRHWSSNGSHIVIGVQLDQ
jgi:hypothetical protein